MDTAAPRPSPAQAESRGPGRGLLALTALASGATALVAQTLWIRALGRAFGTTAEALAAVAGLFLLGLGLGARLGGRRAARSPAPGRAAGRCLLAAALLVMVSPWTFGALPGLHLTLLDLLGLEPGPHPFAALLLSLPLVLAPTLLMGASFPLLLEAYRPEPARLGRGVGGLYALNTLGAALGLLGAVLALPLLGERLSLAAAAALDVAAGAALLFGTGERATPTRPAEVLRGAPAGPGALLLLTGFCGLAFEVAAFRLLEPLTGPHLWGVTLLLGPVLAALALGGWLGGRLADRARRPGHALALTATAAGVLSLLAPVVAGEAPRWLLTAEPGLGRVAWLLCACAATLVPPLTALGAAFALGVRASASAGSAPARAAGDLSALNALGAVAGSLTAGFVLLPAWGAPATLLAVGALLVAGGALRVLALPGSRRALAAALLALPLAAVVAPGARSALLSAAPSLAEVVAVQRAPARIPRADGTELALSLAGRADARLYAEWFGGRPAARADVDGGAPVAAREGRGGTVALLEEPGGSVRLRVNGLAEARFAPDDPEAGSPTETALGLLPALLHPAPRRALVIGHGAGWTSDAVLATDVAEVDVAELDRAVVALAETWRGRPARAASDPRARLWITDGRLLLRRAARSAQAQRYDLIASQPSHPWVPGAGHLFTREAYALARDALAPGGVFAQWINLFDMTPELLRASLATFRDAFPTAWLFLFDREAVVLGFRDRPAIDPARAERLLGGPAVEAVARPAGFVRMGDLWGHLVLDEAGLEAFAPLSVTARVEDDRPSLELTLAWRVLLREPESDLEVLLRSQAVPDLVAALPGKEARERWTGQAIDGLLARGRADVADRWDRTATWGADATARLTRAALARARERPIEAEELLRSVVEAEPARGDVASAWMLFLGEALLVDPGLRDRFLASASPVAARFPDDGLVRAAFARLLERGGDVDAALREYAAALEARRPAAPPGTAAAYARLLLALDPGGGSGTAPAPIVDAGNEAHVLELLRSDPLRLTDRDTLELWARLEQRVGSPALAAEAEARLDALDAASARESFRRGWAALTARDGSGLIPADLASVFDPDDARAFELLALTRLVRGVRAPDEPTAGRERASALLALGQAWRVGGAPAEARARRYLAWFGLDGGLLVRGEAP